MATWKKVIVSGSNAHLTSVTASSAVLVSTNQQITTQADTTKLSGSFSGSFFGDGSGLTGVVATKISATSISDITQQGDLLFVSQSDGLKSITYLNFLNDLAGTNLTVLNNDSLTLASNITGITTMSAAYFTGSFVGDGSGLTNLPAQNTANALTQGAGIQTFSFNGSLANVTVNVKTGSVLLDSVILKWDDGAKQFESSSLTDNGSSITGGTSIQLTGGSSVLTGSFTGSFKGDGSGLTGVGVTITQNTSGYVLLGAGSNSVISGSAGLQYDQNGNTLTVKDTISFTGSSASDSTIYLKGTANVSTASIFADDSSPSVIKIAGAGNTTTIIGNDLIINGDLIANGSSSFINTQNLLVSDKFITLASSSNTNTDGGIIIQNSLSPAGTGSGYAFYLETGIGAPRWSVTSSLNLNSTSATVDEYMVTAKVNSGDPTGNPTWGGINGQGNMYVNTDDSSIWIWS